MGSKTLPNRFLVYELGRDEIFIYVCVRWLSPMRAYGACSGGAALMTPRREQGLHCHGSSSHSLAPLVVSFRFSDLAMLADAFRQSV